MRRAGGQASLELLAGVPALILAALVALQLLLTAHALHLADGAAEAGALAVAGGAAAGPAARAALPGWAERRVRVVRSAGEVAVSLEPPAPTAGLARALEVTSRAWAGPGDG